MKYIKVFMSKDNDLAQADYLTVSGFCNDKRILIYATFTRSGREYLTKSIDWEKSSIRRKKQSTSQLS